MTALDPVAPVALGLAVILVAAKVAGHLAMRAGQVAVLGELLAGVALGNAPVTRALRDDPSIDLLSRLGALVLLFEVGLALTVRDVAAVGGAAVAVAVLGTIASLVLGGVADLALRSGEGLFGHLFVGAALTATSIGITARVLRDLGRARDPEGRVILGAAVLDDVIGLVLLTLVTGAARAGGASPSPAAVGITAGKAVGFFAGTLLVLPRLAPGLFEAAAKLRVEGAQVAVGLAVCFVLAWASSAIGLAAIVGAFTAGLVLEEAHSERFVARGERSLAELVAPVSSFLVPVFFVIMGARVDLRALLDARALALAAVLTVAAVLGKLACALGARGVRRLPVAFGMIPRGEVTLIYASLGATTVFAGRAILDAGLYSALVLVVVATTLVTPMLLRRALAR